MQQQTFSAESFHTTSYATRKRVFLGEMDRVVPWTRLVALVVPHFPAPDKAKGGRPPIALVCMLRIHFMQQWFGLSDPAMQEALHDIPLYRQFAGIALGEDCLPDESTILRFRHRLQEHKLAEQILASVNELLSQQGLLLKVGSAIDATLIPAPTSTKNKSKARDPEMHSSKKGNQWHFGMKAHIGVDADSGLVHTVTGTSGNVHDITEANKLLHGQEQMVFADAGYRGIEKRSDTQLGAKWHIAMGPGKRKALDKARQADSLLDKAEKLKAGVRAKVEHPFRVIKRQFGYIKTRYRGLEKNTQQLITLFALSNLWMVRGKLSQMQGVGG